MGFDEAFRRGVGKETEYPAETHRQWVDRALDERYRNWKFTERDEEFVTDMDALLRLGGKLSKKQEGWLESIYTNKLD